MVTYSHNINEIMNTVVTVWKPFSNPRMFAGYGRQKGWERDVSGNESNEIFQENSQSKIWPDGSLQVFGGSLPVLPSGLSLSMEVAYGKKQKSEE